MKNVLFALPVALFAATAMAQTDTTGGTATDPATGATGTGGSAETGGTYGSNWPLSVGTTFFTEGDSSTLRSSDELTSGWQSLPQNDRDMIMTDCERFMAENGGNASGTTSMDSIATAPAESPASGNSTAASDTDAATTAPAGYTMAQMMAICESVNQF